MAVLGITPGPWALREWRRAPAQIVQADNRSLCIVEMPHWSDHSNSCVSWEAWTANARAIAAVPEMIEALEAVKAALQHQEDTRSPRLPTNIFRALRLTDAALTKILEG